MRYAELISPTTLEGAVEALAGSPGSRPIAGGTDLLVQLKKGTQAPPLFIALRDIDELHRLELVDGNLHLGAGATLSTIVEHPTIREFSPLLSTVASNMASPPVRSRGTLGGNLCNASPAADLAPPLLVHEAAVKLFGLGGFRELSLSSFLTGPGETALNPSELLVEVVIPALPEGSIVGYEKYQAGNHGNLSILSITAALLIDDEDRCTDARVALGAVAPTAVRYTEIEQKLVGTKLDDESLAQAGAIASRTCSPIDDVRASCDHRCQIVEVLLPRIIKRALAERRSS